MYASHVRSTHAHQETHAVPPQWPKMANHCVTKTSSGSKSYGRAQVR